MNLKYKISPSLLCMNFMNAKEQISFLNKVADSFHFDIIDNHFTSSFGLPIEFLTNLKEFSKIPIEVHLMTFNTENIVKELIAINVNTITIHVENITSNAFRIIEDIKKSNIKVGVAINPITPIGYLDYIYHLVDKVSVLTFDPGKAGQQMVPILLEKLTVISEIKEEKKFNFDIEVDGSCNEKNFFKMKNSGANQFVVGKSGLFSLHDNIEIAWSKMLEYMEYESIHR